MGFDQSGTTRLQGERFSFQSPFRIPIRCFPTSCLREEVTPSIEPLLKITGLTIFVIVLPKEGLDGSSSAKPSFGMTRTKMLSPILALGSSIVHKIDSFFYVPFSFLCLQGTTDIVKYSVGRLRPHFLTVCKPNYPITNCTDDQV